MTIRRNLDITRLEIAMQNGWLAGMEIHQCITHGRTQKDGIIFGDVAHALHTLTKVFPFYIVHYQVLTLVTNHKVVCNARQVWMTQVGKNDSFKAKLARILIGGEQVFLHCYIHAQVFIYCAIHGTHASLPEYFDNAISLM